MASVAPSSSRYLSDDQPSYSYGLRPSNAGYEERTEDAFDMDDLDDPLPVPGLSDETSSSSSAPSSTQTSPVVAAALGTVDEPSALSLPPAVKSLHTFHFNYSYSIPSKHDAPAAVAQSLPHDFSLNQTSSVETIKLNRRLLSPRLNPVGNPTSSPRIHPAQPPSVPPVFEDEAADGSGEHASVPLSRRCSRPGCAIGHASSTAGLLPSGRRSSAPQVPRIGSGRRSSQLGMAEPSVPSSSPVDDDDEPNHSAFGSYLLRAARPASPPAPPASTSVAPTPRQPPSILHTSRGGGVSTGGIGVRPVRFLFSRRATSPPDDTATDELDRGRSRDRERPSGAATVRSPSPKARAGASGSRSRSRGVVPDPNRRRSHA